MGDTPTRMYQRPLPAWVGWVLTVLAGLAIAAGTYAGQAAVSLAVEARAHELRIARLERDLVATQADVRAAPARVEIDALRTEMRALRDDVRELREDLRRRTR